MFWLLKIWQVSSCGKFMQRLETCLLIAGECVYLSANRFSMAWEKGIKCHIHFSFSHDIEKQIWILLFVFLFSPNFEKWFWTSYFVFRFHFEKRISISVFVFRFRITLKNGFEFRFSFSHHFEKQIWISFVIFAWLVKRITAPVQSFEAPATPSGLTGAFTFYVTESKRIFLSPGPKWVVNSPLPMICHTHGTPFFNNGWQMKWW